mmetsp:Transcript_38631/g.109266  ORF Transcript_38631/g.109266 Transcript_38631/m.109266 type:complete len:306 (+) Transcript_38631:766-1683(+)
MHRPLATWNDSATQPTAALHATSQASIPPPGIFGVWVLGFMLPPPSSCWSSFALYTARTGPLQRLLVRYRYLANCCWPARRSSPSLPPRAWATASLSRFCCRVHTRLMMAKPPQRLSESHCALHSARLAFLLPPLPLPLRSALSACPSLGALSWLPSNASKAGLSTLPFCAVAPRDSDNSSPPAWRAESVTSAVTRETSSSSCCVVRYSSSSRGSSPLAAAPPRSCCARQKYCGESTLRPASAGRPSLAATDLRSCSSARVPLPPTLQNMSTMPVLLLMKRRLPSGVAATPAAVPPSASPSPKWL